MKRLLAILFSGCLLLTCPACASETEESTQQAEEETALARPEGESYPKGSRLNPYELGDEIDLGMTCCDNEYMEVALIPEELLDDEETAALFPGSWRLSDTETVAGKIRTGSASSDDERVSQTFTVEFYTENMGSMDGRIHDRETSYMLDGLYSYFEYQVLFVPDYYSYDSDKTQVSMMKIEYYPDKEAYNAGEPTSVWVKLT